MKRPKLLGIDTASPRTRVFVAHQQVEYELTLARQETARRLPGAVDRVLEAVGWQMEEVELFLANRGPGSLTGIRVGIAFLRFLAMAVPRPLVGVSGLDAGLYHLLSKLPSAEEARWGAVVLQAVGGEIFFAVYTREHARWRLWKNYRRGRWEDFWAHLPAKCPVITQVSPPEVPPGRTVLWEPLLPTTEAFVEALRDLGDWACEPLYLYPPVRAERTR